MSSQTLGLNVTYTPVSWWSHKLTLGRDVTNQKMQDFEAPFSTLTDSIAKLLLGNSARTSTSYSSTVNVPMREMATLNVTLGADGWQTQTLSSNSAPAAGTPGTVVRGSHNAGMFVQGMLGFWNAMYITYGLRAEWNPNYGDEAQPNMAPKYGIALAHDFGVMTAKLRASYGRSTRPPLPTQKLGQYAWQSSSAATYNSAFGTTDFYLNLPNPDLGPETQQGGEGGLELYFGTRGSLQITRYNQTVNDLIAQISFVDSLVLPGSPGCSLGQALIAALSGMPTRNSESGQCLVGLPSYLNAASIRNQGWELTGTLNFGPLSTRATYSQTVSRVLGITPAYRQRVVAVTVVDATYYIPGQTIRGPSERAWSIVPSYVRGGTSLTLNLNGIGRVGMITTDEYRDCSYARLPVYYPIVGNCVNAVSTGQVMRRGYTMADLNATQRLSANIDGTFQMKNLTDHYRSDVALYSVATIGRQTWVGLRVRW